MAQAELHAALRAFRDLELVRFFKRRHFDIGAECSLGDVYRDGAVQIGFLPFEERVLFDLKDHVQILWRAAVSAGMAFVRHTQSGAVIHARRDVHLELTLHLAIALAAAFLAGVADELAAAVARTAGTAHGKEALLIDHFAASVAGRAGGRARSGLGALAAAALARLDGRHLNFRGRAEYGLFKTDLQIVADILAALRPVAPALTPAAEQVTET